ncbi:MAG: hypothetical protein JWM40_516, partial [Frankiales bacterium]|nr:hypothetical protein [Frankiales bacterium]
RRHHAHPHVPRRPPLALLLLALLTGCSDSTPAAVPIPTPSAAASAGCADLIARLPHELPQGLKQRATVPPSTTTTAWGDPPIVLRCGVPAGLEVDDPYSFNAVRWAMHDVGAARRWTTKGLTPNVEVVVPDAYSSQAELLGSLAQALLNR